MNFLHLILLALMGFLTSSATAVPHQMIDVATGNIGQDVDPAPGRELAARQGFPSSLLLEYDLKCALDRKKTPMAPGMSGSFLTAAYCKSWFVCQSDGKDLRDTILHGLESLLMYAVGSKKATDKKLSNQPWKLDPENRDWQVRDICVLLLK